MSHFPLRKIVKSHVMFILVRDFGGNQSGIRQTEKEKWTHLKKDVSLTCKILNFRLEGLRVASAE